MTEPTKINGSVSRMIETEADRFSFEITAGNQKIFKFEEVFSASDDIHMDNRS